MDAADKERIKRAVADCLKGEPEVERVVVFGSFNAAPEPADLDIAVFQDSDLPYMPLAMKYRKCLRPVVREIDVDVLPVHGSRLSPAFAEAIARGEVVYVRRSA